MPSDEHETDEKSSHVFAHIDVIVVLLLCMSRFLNQSFWTSRKNKYTKMLFWRKENPLAYNLVFCV